MPATLAEFDSLVHSIYGAVGHADGWEKVLAAIVGCVGGERAIAYIQDVPARRLLFSVTHRIEPEIAARFERDHLNAFLDTYTHLPPGAAMLGSKPQISYPELERSALYREIFMPSNIYYGSGGLLLRAGNAFGFIFIFRSRVAGPFARADESMLLRLIPHLARATELHYRLLSSETGRAAALTVLDRIAYGIAICGADGTLHLANAMAQELLRARRGISLNGNRIVATNRKDAELAAAAIRDVAAGTADHAGIAIATDDEPLRLTLTRLPDDLVPEPADDAGLVLLCINDPTANLTGAAGVLKDIFGLTETEARVAFNLARGKTMDAIATSTGVSRNTVRTHVAAAFSKTDTSRQADLVRTVLRSIGPFGFD